MDDATDLALYRIEKEIARRRDSEPCEEYERTSRLLPQCRNCGWIHQEDACASRPAA